jgi:glycosyltransferase involved in cell wall biosynthesis
MKLLFVAPLPKPITGQSIACELLFNSIKKKYTVNLIDINKKSFNQGFNSLLRFFVIVAILRKIYLRKVNVDLIYFTVSESMAGLLKDIAIYIICWFKLHRMVIHLHGGAGMRFLLSKKHPLLRFINSFFLKRIGGVIVLGDRLKSIYVGLVPAGKLYVVPNFANDEFFVERSTISAKFDSLAPLRLLFLSNLLPGKGHVELLAAFALLPVEHRRRLRVDFAGGFESSHDEKQFRQQVQNVEDMEIHVHGVVQGEHKRQLLEKAHLFCLPTYYPYEGQPISILEAYASGCAVMTTDHSGIFDTFTPGMNGLEVLPRNSQSIATALIQALAQPEKLYEFAKNNSLHANQKYRASIHLEALEKIIFSVGEKRSQV